ncbi:Copper transport outer membrane protein, MctB [Thermomonospora echinospora]|uniref:Copper transport outer membrane protein, MctB n=1 Tax=Thermomonospora echinospora TaxID=1992 RepID=A0A1H6BUG8_9ACTN|nr:copper transporter [Thermomonospora echinospora]SEG64348.1 Copper transport outer membrane protein, MctB [Thermomonospora echinospora]
MIDFRYHLVSIVAIFLSLAVGLVLGATALSDPLLGTLKKESNAAIKRSEELRARQLELLKQIEGEEQFSRTVARQLLAGRLKDQSVVLVETPGAGQESLNKISELLGEDAAGATVTGRVTIQKKFLDDDQLATLDQLAEQLRPAQMKFSDGAGPYDKAGQVLAAALLTGDSAKALRDDASGKATLEAFKSAGFVTVSGKPAQHATLAVMVAPSSPYQDGADVDNRALISLAGALDSAGRGTVLAGPTTAAGEGGLIAALRESDAADEVSSVDVIDQSSGQVVTVLALESQIAGKTGHYGTGEGAGAYLPTPAPAPGGSG